MQVTKQINSTRFNEKTKAAEVNKSFVLTGVISSDDYDGTVFTVSKIEMDGAEVSGDKFYAEITDTAVGLDGFIMMMQQRWEVSDIRVETTQAIECHTPVAFVE